MTYFDGFIAPVRAANKDAYRAHAEKFAAIASEFGIKRIIECWADEVPHGSVTDFYRSVRAGDDETVVFSLFEYPSRKERDAAADKFRTDPRMREMMTDVPFDPARMILGGFTAIVEQGQRPGGYINAFVIPVRHEHQEAYRALTDKQAAIFREQGALRLVQAWGDDIPDGKSTDFRRAVHAESNETVVLGFIEWPSKAASLEAWDRIMKDERMHPSADPPFDGKRMFWGGFELLLDTARTEPLMAQVPVAQDL